jgi:DNA-binding transcriptional ArsR family regulator
MMQGRVDPASMAPSSQELNGALRHPLRRRILLAYLDGGIQFASAGELAATTDERVGQVDYHLKTLGKYELLRLAPAGWALDVEASWLRLVLELWGESNGSDVSR